MTNKLVVLVLFILSFLSINCSILADEIIDKNQYIVYDGIKEHRKELMRCYAFQYDGDENSYIFYTKDKTIKMSANNRQLSVKGPYICYWEINGRIYAGGERPDAFLSMKPIHPGSRIFKFHIDEEVKEL